MNLTASQKRAVTTDSPEVLVIAGAGSGKTRVLTQRIVHLMTECGVPASDMLVLTFTRKAAEELRGRLETALDGKRKQPRRELGNMLLGTFHSVALKILTADGEKIGYRPDTLTIVDPADADLLMQQTLHELGWSKKITLKDSALYRNLFYSKGEFDDRLPSFKTAFNLYRTRLRAMNALDYGLILIECQRLFAECPVVLASYRRRIKHVLVDELQDSDETQYNLHDFFSPPATFFGVGDPFGQSIYGFRGARPELMRARHQNAEVIHLNECFRCGDRIVETANRLISRNQEPLWEPMVGATERSGDVCATNGRSEAIVSQIARLMNKYGHKRRDIAVLCRTHGRGKAPRDCARIAALLNEAGIPAHHVGAGFDICETDEFRLVHAALRLCVNYNDNLAFLRLKGALGLSDAQYAECARLAAVKGTSLWSGYVEWCEGEYVTALGRVIAGGGLDLFEVLDESDELLMGMALDEIMLSLPPDLPDQSRQFWRENCESMTIADALRWYSLTSQDADRDAAGIDEVWVGTVHAAKGLEWPVVIGANWNEGSFPSRRSLKEDGGEAEERRLAYVLITRARERLLLHWRSADDQAADRAISPPSRFLTECGLFKDDTNVGATSIHGRVDRHREGHRGESA